MNDFDVHPSPVRVVELENGNKLNMTRTDPYGLITFSLERGQLPDSLKGASFTDWGFAEKAAQKYVQERQDAVAEIKIKAPKVK